MLSVKRSGKLAIATALIHSQKQSNSMKKKPWYIDKRTMLVLLSYLLSFFTKAISLGSTADYSMASTYRCILHQTTRIHMVS